MQIFKKIKAIIPFRHGKDVQYYCFYVLKVADV